MMLAYAGAALCSEGSMLRRFYIPKVLHAEGSIFQRFHGPKVLCVESYLTTAVFEPQYLHINEISRLVSRTYIFHILYY